MEYTLLKKAADSPEALILRESTEIEAFRVLLEKGLVAGHRHRPEGQPAYAVIHCLTPDGKALLSLTEFVVRARLKGSVED